MSYAPKANPNTSTELIEFIRPGLPPISNLKMSTVAKYWDKYQKRNKPDAPSEKKLGNLMTDRQAYISFLEV
jgi:hypothetical protein